MKITSRHKLRYSACIQAAQALHSKWKDILTNCLTRPLNDVNDRSSTRVNEVICITNIFVPMAAHADTNFVANTEREQPRCLNFNNTCAKEKFIDVSAEHSLSFLSAASIY